MEAENTVTGLCGPLNGIKSTDAPRTIPGTKDQIPQRLAHHSAPEDFKRSPKRLVARHHDWPNGGLLDFCKRRPLFAVLDQRSHVTDVPQGGSGRKGEGS